MEYKLTKICIGNQDCPSEKIVMLRLAPNIEKLSKLNMMNMQKEDNEKTLSNSTTDFERSVKDQDVSSGNYIDVFGQLQCPEQLQTAIKEIEQGFKKGLKPKLTDDGTSGTYLMRGVSKKPLAVFKPIDEEAFAPNNPRDHVGRFGSQSFRAGVLSGEACIREVAAYLLDKEGFSGVPSTTMIESHLSSLK
jgi:hypothetical protein